MIVTIHRNIVCSNFVRNTIFLIGKPKNNRVTDKESKNFSYLCQRIKQITSIW